MSRSILFTILSLALIATGCAGGSASSTSVQRQSTSFNPGDPSIGPLCVDTTSASSEIKELREEICELTNFERAKAGVAPVRLDSRRSSAAQGHAEEMSLNGFFSHTSPTSGSFTDRLKDAGASFSTAGENIARNTVIDSQLIMGQWMNSSGHRENIMKSGYGRLGVGFASGRWVQVFTN